MGSITTTHARGFSARLRTVFEKNWLESATRSSSIMCTRDRCVTFGMPSADAVAISAGISPSKHAAMSESAMRARRGAHDGSGASCVPAERPGVWSNTDSTVMTHAYTPAVMNRITSSSGVPSASAMARAAPGAVAVEADAIGRRRLLDQRGAALELHRLEGGEVGGGQRDRAALLDVAAGHRRLDREQHPQMPVVEHLDPPGPAGVGQAVGVDRAHDQRARRLQQLGELGTDHARPFSVQVLPK